MLAAVVAVVALGGGVQGPLRGVLADPGGCGYDGPWCRTCDPGYYEGYRSSGQGGCFPCSEFNTNIGPGFYGPGGKRSTCTACNANTRLVSGTSSTQESACTPCGTGLSTADKPGQTSCAFVKPGYRWLLFNARPCPVDTYASTHRPKSSLASWGCTPCPLLTSTLGKTGQTSKDACVSMVPTVGRRMLVSMDGGAQLEAGRAGADA